MHIYIECLFCTIKKYLHFRSKEISSTGPPNSRAKLQRKLEKIQRVSNHIYFNAVNTLLLVLCHPDFMPYNFKGSLLQAVFYIFILRFFPIHLPKYTHTSSLMGTIPWDRGHVGVLLLVQHQKRLPKRSRGHLEDETKLTLVCF